MARKKGSKDYDIETKKQAIRMFMKEGLSYQEITRILSIRDPKRVKRWVFLYREGGEEALKKPRRGRPRKQKGEETLEQKVKRLEMENDLLKKYHAELRKLTGGKPDTEPFTMSGKSTR
jgi:transposase